MVQCKQEVEVYEGGVPGHLKKIWLVVTVTFAFAFIGSAKQTIAQDGLNFLQRVEREIQTIVERLGPSVVTIRAITRTTVTPGQDPDPRQGAVLSTFIGSGVVLDTSGHILTTAQVAEGRDRFLVELPDMRIYEATLVGQNAAADVAVLRTIAPGLRPPAWGNSDGLRSGSIIVVMGNSYGCPLSVTWGTINGFRPDGTTIQLNAPVTAGNSGGAVINSAGEVVGLVKAKVSEPSSVPAMRIRRPENPAEKWVTPPFNIELPTSGVALAVPINTALEVARRVLGGNGEEYPYLGVYVTDLNSVLVQYYHTDQGVVVGGVVENTPAQQFGLQRGDLIRSFNQVPVTSVRQFRQLVAASSPGDRIWLDILRGGTMALKIKLVMGRAGTPGNLQDKRSLEPQMESDLLRQTTGIQGTLHSNDSMSIERLNEIRRRILQSADSLGGMPVDHKVGP